MKRAAKMNRPQRWAQLYQDLRRLLTSRGVESPFGSGDFWIVDDDWGGALQKVYIFRIEFLTAAMVRRIQNLLATGYPEWGVMIQLDIGPENAKLCPPEGVVVFSDCVRYDWNVDLLKKIFGDAFAWS